MLDIGAHWGYFCHQFESLGFDCTAVEAVPESVHFLRALRDACGRTFAIHEGSVFDQPLEVRYDVVLALGAFHQLLKREADFYRLIEILERLDTDTMVLEAYLPERRQMAHAFRRFAPEELVAFVAEHSALRSVNRLRGVEDAPDLSAPSVGARNTETRRPGCQGMKPQLLAR